MNEINRTNCASAGALTIVDQGVEPADDRRDLEALNSSSIAVRDRIRQLRRQVHDDRYDCPLKLSIALDRMIAKVVTKP